ncbi:MAG TPA: site-2 protease family protein [Jiangellaceae bacterium]
MLTSALRLFRVRGVPVGVSWSWLLVFLLVLWSLATALFPSSHPGLGGATYLAMATVATVLFFGSILVHELSHTLRALREGIRVREITLWLFGGVSRADEPLPSPAAEFRVVAAGPLASAALALAFFGAAAAGRALGSPDSVVAVADYLAWINGLLLAFNVVPALPLDGGRLLHALLWWRTGDRSVATVSAAMAGRAFAAVLIAVGLVTLVGGIAVTGIWFTVLGWFLLQAVQQEVLGARLEQALDGLQVRDVMGPAPVPVPSGSTIAAFANLIGHWSSHPAYPVTDGNRLVGVIVVRDATNVPGSQRGSIRVADIMLAGDDLPVVYAGSPAVEALPVLQQGHGLAAVLDSPGGPISGMLSAADLARGMEHGRPWERPVERRGRTGRWLGLSAALGIVALAGVLYHPPFVVISPGNSFDVTGDITISGAPVQQPTGPYLLTFVSVSQPNALSQLVAAVRTDRQVVAAGRVIPSGITPDQFNEFEHQLFLDSQQTAAVAAATSAGYYATLNGSGAEVLGIVGSSPAAGVLEVGDTITAVNETSVATATDLHDALAGRPSGEHLTLSVTRGHQLLRVHTPNARLPEVSGGTGIGVVATTKDLRADLPFQIDFRQRPDIGGPSAGLAYSLAITDMLDHGDDAGGRAVAATGTIAADGTVGPVGGVHEKAIAAKDAGAAEFLVPAGEVSSVDHAGLSVLGVNSLDQAVRSLAA